jgi:hypothetical protein
MITKQSYIKNRTETILKMYDYQGEEPKQLIIPNSNEKIYNWYIEAIPTVERLLEIIREEDIAKIYDNPNIFLKIFVKNRIFFNNEEPNPSTPKGGSSC